jgi:toxin ParE1/3/4
MAELEYSVEAVADIDSIVAFSVEQFGKAVADVYLTRLEAACDQLRLYPQMAAVYPRLRPATRCLIYRRHRIFYRVARETVLIVRILHHAQDVKRAMN